MATTPLLIMIAGGPGAGKTALGRALARTMNGAVLLDKDTAAGGWVDAMLARLNGGQIDRDSDVYWKLLRPLEYQSLVAIALDNLALGKSVVAVAPFGPELTDDGWLARLDSALHELGARRVAVWLETDPGTAKSRMQGRGHMRDTWKLANWDMFLRSARFGPPREGLLVLHNGGQARLPDLVNQLVNQLSIK